MPAVASVPNHDLPPRVLLVDDDPMWRMLIAHALRERGYRVSDFDRAQDALAALTRDRPDCVVADVLMPGMDGFEFCRRVRMHRDGARLPLLMLTSLDEDEATRRAYEAGASDYCIKSVNWTLLSHRIRMLLRVAELERVAGTDTPALPDRRAIAGAFDWQPAARHARLATGLVRMLDWTEAPPLVHDRDLLALVTPADRRRLRRAVVRLLRGGPAVRHEVEVATLSGRHRRLRVDVHQIATTPGGATQVSGTVHDVTPTDRTDARIYRLTHYDALTGLPSRAWLVDRLHGVREGAEAPGGFAILSIDRFRHVSEALGQAAGDRLLVEVAQRLRKLAHDTRVGPADAPGGGALTFLGGEEFGLLLDADTDREAGLAIGRAAVATLREPFHVAGREVFLRASVGVHVAGVGTDERAGWIGRADLARRSATALGGNCAIAFEAAMADTGSDRLEMERDLHYALRRGEMTMHFQPQYSTGTGRLVGFEALMRWSRQGALQPAGTFIPLAEETGLIVPLGEWAIGEACAALAAIRALGHHDCVMSVNLSCQQLRTGRLPRVVADALAAHGVPASGLEVELTESGMMQDPEVAVAELKAVRALGAGLAVDDFGTGYSSLAYLTRLPLTTLKIDRSFVQDLHGSERSLAVARAIVALGSNLHLRVVAEGVETALQRQALSALGCDLQQGYLYGRAVPLDEALRIAALPDGTMCPVPQETNP